jgi:4-coumarate--CoA ligase
MGNCYSSEDHGEPCDAIIHKSPHAELAIPDMTMWQVAEQQAQQSADKPAFVCGLTHEVITFGDLFTRANRLAAALQSDGVGKGTVVLLHSFNCIEYPIAVLALNGLGAVCSPSSPMFLANELSRQISTSKARFVIVHKQLENVAFEAASNAGLASDNLYTIGSTKAETKHHFKDIKYVQQQTLGR